MRDGTSGALTNSGGIDGNGRARNVARVVLGGLAVIAGIIVVGGGIALFLTALFS